MISLYESLLADIDDTLDQGDTISAEILANDENSLLRKVFPVNSRVKNPYEILEHNGKKMLSLKALDHLYDIIDDSGFTNNQTGFAIVMQLIEVIKQDLERLGVLEKKNQELYEKVNHLKNVKNRWRRNCKFLEKENEKLKQVLDIFERKHIHIYYLTRTKNVEEYNKMMDKFNEYDFFDYLIKEDYELLKEVLGNEN